VPFLCITARKKDVLFIRTRPLKGIISGAKIVSQLYHGLHQWILSRRLHQSLDVCHRSRRRLHCQTSSGWFYFCLDGKVSKARSPAPPLTLVQYRTRNALRNLKNLFSAGVAHALFPGRYPARAMSRIFIRGPHPRGETLPHYYSVTHVIEEKKKTRNIWKTRKNETSLHDGEIHLDCKSISSIIHLTPMLRCARLF